MIHQKRLRPQTNIRPSMRRIIIINILLLATILRFAGIGHQLPYTFMNEEATILDKAVGVADGYLRHGVILRGSLPYYVTGISIKVASFIFPSIFPRNNIRSAYEMNKNYFYLLGRAISAMYGVAEVFLVYLLGTILFGSWIGVLASFFQSILPLSIQYAHIITPDTALSATILLAFLICIHARMRNNPLLFLISAIIIGLSVGQKLPGILAIPTLLFIIGSSLWFIKHRLKKKVIFILLCVLLIIVAYLTTYPFLPQDFQKLNAEWQWENRFEIHGISDYQLPNIGFWARFNQQAGEWLPQATGTFFFLASILGILVTLWYRQKPAIFLFIFIASFMVGISIPIPSTSHWLLPVLPYMSIFAAKGILVIRSHTSRHLFLRTFTAVLMITLVPMMRSILLVDSYMKPDTRILEADWVGKHQLEEKFILRDLYTSVDPPLQRLLSKITVSQMPSFQYAIVSSYYYLNFLTDTRYRWLAEKYRYLFSNYPQVAEFQPQRTPYQNDLQFLLNMNLFVTPVNGPIIKIYKLK